MAYIFQNKACCSIISFGLFSDDHFDVQKFYNIFNAINFGKRRNQISQPIVYKVIKVAYKYLNKNRPASLRGGFLLKSPAKSDRIYYQFRVSYNGITTGFQPVNRGSIPLARSKFYLTASFRFFPARNFGTFMAAI